MPTLQPFTKKVTSPTYVNLDSTSGATIANKVPNSCSTRKSLDKFWDQLAAKATKCVCQS